MLHKSIDFDWQIVDEAAWVFDASTEPPNGAPEHFSEAQLTALLLRGLMLIAVVLVITGSITRSPEQLARGRAHEAVSFALAKEHSLLQQQAANATPDLQQYTMLLDQNVPNQWRLAWQKTWETRLEHQAIEALRLLEVATADELMVATVMIDNPTPEWGESRRYREKRYYRLHHQEWLRTIPSAAQRGTLQTIETERFRLEYYAMDTAVSQAVSERLEPIYAKLYARLDMPTPTNKGKQTIALVPAIIRNWHSYRDRIEFTSPALAAIPATQSDEHYVLEMVVSRLTHQAVQEAMARTRTGTEYRWNLMLWGIRSWLLQDLTGEQSPWSAEAVPALRATLANNPQVDLTLLNRWYSTDQPSEAEIMARYLLAESMITYALATYGTDRLPTLLQDFSYYSQWHHLIPQVFDVSMEEFEAGWQAYVLETYGIKT